MQLLFDIFQVSANAKEEFMFLFSVKVMEEVKSDALYEFQPPFNIMAGILVWPCSFVYDSTVVGKLSRVLLRFFYFPELICIWIFEVLILQKQPQYMPVRPGLVDHSGTYGSTALPSQTIGGGVAKRRRETASAAANSVSTSDSAAGSHDVGEFALDLDNDSPTSTSHDTDPERMQQGTTTTTDPQKFNRINTNTQSIPDDPQPHEILSPYFENIRRFRDSKNNSATSSSASMKSEGDHPPVSHYNPSVYSFHPAAPIGMGTGGLGRLRQGSVSGYQRYRYGTDATLSNTFQGVWPSYDQGPMMANGPGHGYQGGRGGPADTSQWYDDEYNPDDEVTRLIEARFTEMRTRMEEIDAKLDRLMNAILMTDRDVSE